MAGADGGTRSAQYQSIQQAHRPPQLPVYTEGPQPYAPRPLAPRLLDAHSNAPTLARVPTFIEVPDRYPWEWTLHSKRNAAALHQVTITDADLPRRWRQQQAWQFYPPPPPPQQARTLIVQPGQAPAAAVTYIPFRRQQLWPYADQPYPQQRRALQIQGVAITGDPLPGVKTVPTFGTIDDPQPQQKRPSRIVPFVAPFTGDNPPPLRRHPVWGWGATTPIWGLALEVQEPALGLPNAPSFWFNTVYKAWEPPYTPPQQKIVVVRESGPVVAPVVGDPPPSVRVPVIYEIPDQQPQQGRARVTQAGTPAAPGDNPPVKSGPWQYRVLVAWQPPEPLPQQRIIVVRESGPVIIPPTPEEPVGVGGVWVPHNFSRRKCRELLEEIARERKAAQALAPAPKKAVLAAASATAAAVRDACDLCPAEASAAIYAEAKAVVDSLHRIMAADLRAKALIARAKEVERRAIMLRRAAEEADEDDAISILLMGV